MAQPRPQYPERFLNMAQQYPSWYTGPRLNRRKYQREPKYRRDMIQAGIDYRRRGGRTQDRMLYADQMRAQTRRERMGQRRGRSVPQTQRMRGARAAPPGPGRFKVTPYTPGSGRRVRGASYQPSREFHGGYAGWKPVRLPGFAQQRSPSGSRRHINRLNPLSSRRGRGGGSRV
jgi:hypothetical protein